MCLLIKHSFERDLFKVDVYIKRVVRESWKDNIQLPFATHVVTGHIRDSSSSAWRRFQRPPRCTNARKGVAGKISAAARMSVIKMSR